jgi:hypothetical protein
MGETKKAIDALNAILRVFGRFKTLYFHYKVRRTGTHQHSGPCLHGLGFCSVFGARLAVTDQPLLYVGCVWCRTGLRPRCQRTRGAWRTRRCSVVWTGSWSGATM